MVHLAVRTNGLRLGLPVGASLDRAIVGRRMDRSIPRVDVDAGTGGHLVGFSLHEASHWVGLQRLVHRGIHHEATLVREWVLLLLPPIHEVRLRVLCGSCLDLRGLVRHLIRVGEDVVALVDEGAVYAWARLHFLLEVLLLDSFRSLGEGTSPGLLRAVQWSLHFAIYFAVTCAIGADGRDARLVLDVCREVFVSRDAFEGLACVFRDDKGVFFGQLRLRRGIALVRFSLGQARHLAVFLLPRRQLVTQVYFTDLSFEVAHDFSDEFESLLRDFKASGRLRYALVLRQPLGRRFHILALFVPTLLASRGILLDWLLQLVLVVLGIQKVVILFHLLLQLLLRTQHDKVVVVHLSKP